jgi:hypothetical protein
VRIRGKRKEEREKRKEKREKRKEKREKRKVRARCSRWSGPYFSL